MGLRSFFLKKSPWLLHFNTGSCFPGDVQVILGDGRLVKIGELVENHLRNVPANPHAFVEVFDEIISWDTSAANVMPLIRVHKLKSPGKLVEVVASSGVPVRMTSDHPVLVDRKNGPVWVEARYLKPGDYLYSPRVIRIRNASPPDLIDYMPKHYLAHLEEGTKSEIIRMLREKFGSLKKASASLGVNIPRFSRGRNFRIDQLEKICDVLGLKWDDLKKKIKIISGKNLVRDISALKIDEDFMRMLGLIASDGSLIIKKGGGYSTYRVSFSNKDHTLVEDFVDLCGEWVPRDKVNVYLDRADVLVVAVYDPVIANVATGLGFSGNDGEVDLRPIFRLEGRMIAHFLGGYFDGDGHVTITNKNGRIGAAIWFSTNSFERAKGIHLLLKRLAIASTVKCSFNKSTFGARGTYKVLVSDPNDMLRFVEQIPIRHPKKLTRAKLVIKLMNGNKRIKSEKSLAPIRCGELIKNIIRAHGLKQVQISRRPAFLSTIEKGKRTEKETLKKIVQRMQELGIKDENLNELQAFLSDDYYLDRVIEVRKISTKEEWVYDLTVEETHSFIPEGAFVVKNCNGCDIELLAALTPRYDVERMGIKLCGSPRHADILMVTGPVTRQSKERLLRIYEQMPEPKLVVGIGSCPASGCAFHDCYNIVGPLDKLLPVAAYVPGCPPRPETIIHGLLKVLEKV